MKLATPPLSIGVSVGGTGAEARAWGDAAAMALARRVKLLRDGVDTPLKVNVVYDVPGEVVSLDYEGIRTGRFSKRDSLLMVQVALPEHFPPDADERLIGDLSRAVDVAEAFAQRRGSRRRNGSHGPSFDRDCPHFG